MLYIQLVITTHTLMKRSNSAIFRMILDNNVDDLSDEDIIDFVNEVKVVKNKLEQHTESEFRSSLTAKQTDLLKNKEEIEHSIHQDYIKYINTIKEIMLR